MDVLVRRGVAALSLVYLTISGCGIGDPVEQVWVTNESGSDYVVRLGSETPRLAVAGSAGLAYDFPAPWRSQLVVVMSTTCERIAEIVNSEALLKITIDRAGAVHAEQGAHLSDLVGGELVRTSLCAE